MSGNDMRVLIVDDQAPFRDAARAVVEATAGCTVVGAAETGEEGLELARSVRPDVVVLDVNLPDLDGVEVSRRLTEERSATAVVLVSTYDVDECADDVSRCGAVGYLRKSEFGPDRLLELLERNGP